MKIVTKKANNIVYTLKVNKSFKESLEKILNFNTMLGVFENKKRFKVDYKKTTTKKGGMVYSTLINAFDRMDNNSLLISLHEDGYLPMDIPLKTLANRGGYFKGIFNALGKVIEGKGNVAARNAYHKKWLQYFKDFFFNGYWGTRFDMRTESAFRRGVYTGQLADAFKYKEGKIESNKHAD